jgi:hypothetical protein
MIVARNPIAGSQRQGIDRLGNKRGVFMSKRIIGLAIASLYMPMALAAQDPTSTNIRANVVASNATWTLTGARLSSDGSSIQCSEACVLTSTGTPAITKRAERIVLNTVTGTVTISGAGSMTSDKPAPSR